MQTEAINLLKTLIALPSFSRQEDRTAFAIARYLDERKVDYHRKKNNVYAFNQYFDAAKPTLLLNSHHDTVQPVKGWTKDPFFPLEQDGKLFGLGSNDAGGSLVALLHTFIHFYGRRDLAYNLIVAATAEEEISGADGVASILADLPPIAAGIVGEPTLLQPAVAQKGLLVIDATARGLSGHAAREEGINAIYLALADVEKIRNYRFPKVSPWLGPVKMTVAQIQAGRQHNVVPDECSFVIDVRTNECYSNEEIFDLLIAELGSGLRARSFRLRSASIPLEHPLVQKAVSLGLTPFGSPTLSDSALLPFPALKLGCGNSARSHTADEYIYLHEIEAGIATYIQLLEGLRL